MSSIPTSLPLQKKMLEDKFPEASAKSWFLVWFPGEMAYSVVEKKTIMDDNPKIKQHVTVKGSKGEQWKCQIVFKGTKDECVIKQRKLENLLDDETYDEEEPPCKKRKETLENDDDKVNSDEDSSDEEELSENEEQKDIEREKEKVKALLAKKKQKDSTLNKVKEDPKVAIPEKLLKELFDGVYKRLNTISNLLQQQVTAAASAPSTPVQKKIHVADRVVAKEESSPQSPAGSSTSFNVIVAEDVDNEEFIYNGTNLLHQVSAKAKKPKLYATALLSHLFEDKEMREGCVEPKEGATKKPALEQTKIELIKKCIKAKYGEKVLERSWPEI